MNRKSNALVSTIGQVLVTALVSVVLAVALLGGTQATTGVQLSSADAGETSLSLHAKAPRWMTTPCVTEDSVRCYLDASVFGNGVGHSFYAICAGRDLVLAYWQPRYAGKHNEILKGECRRG